MGSTCKGSFWTVHGILLLLFSASLLSVPLMITFRFALGPVMMHTLVMMSQWTLLVILYSYSHNRFSDAIWPIMEGSSMQETKSQSGLCFQKCASDTSTKPVVDGRPNYVRGRLGCCFCWVCCPGLPLLISSNKPRDRPGMSWSSSQPYVCEDSVQSDPYKMLRPKLMRKDILNCCRPTDRHIIVMLLVYR